MRILMTGASGFLGQAFLRAASADLAIFALGRSPPPVARNNLCHIEVDFASPSSLQTLIDGGRLPGGLDAVLHLAVSRQHRAFPESAIDIFNVNAATVALLLDFAQKTKISKFVVGSTGTVYHPFKNCQHHEDDVTAPGSYFALSKWIAEQTALTYYPQYFNVFIPRFFSPYGPGQKDRVIPTLVDRVKTGQPIQLPMSGDGFSTTPLYVDDAVRVLAAAIDGDWTGAMNVGGPDVLTLVEMASIIGKAVGREPVFERSNNALDAFLVPDLGRLSAKISLTAFARFGEGVLRVLSGDG